MLFKKVLMEVQWDTEGKRLSLLTEINSAGETAFVKVKASHPNPENSAYLTLTPTKAISNGNIAVAIALLRVAMNLIPAESHKIKSAFCAPDSQGRTAIRRT